MITYCNTFNFLYRFQPFQQFFQHSMLEKFVVKLRFSLSFQVFPQSFQQFKV